MAGRAALIAIVFGLALYGIGPVASAHDGVGLEAYRRLDFAAALAVWLPLARKGDAYAQTWIGVMHAEGKGVAKEPAAAIRWFRRAASQGYAEAEYQLGVIHEFGHGVDEDKAMARRYYERAANHAHVEAQLRLSELYEFGIGTAVDLVHAHMWADIAERISSTHSERVRAGGNRDTLEEIMTPDQTAEARRLAQAWVERHPPGD